MKNLSQKNNIKPTFGEAIVKLDLKQNKHIPQEYLRASKKQRLALLQGLMDTDGYCSKNGLCEFTSIYKHLAEQVQELVCSLGLRARLIKKKYYKRSVESRIKQPDELWIVRFTAYKDTPVFNLKRKLSRLKDRNLGRPTETEYRRIVNIEKVKSFPTKCIEVSSKSNLFLIGREFLPTHNTEAGNNWVGYVIDQAPGPMLIVQPTVEMAKRWSKGRLAPLINDTPCLRGKVQDPRSRDSGNTIQSKEFPGGIAVITGANSAVGLRSMPELPLLLLVLSIGRRKNGRKLSIILA